MGSRSAQAARDAMAARVQAGELTASQAYALDKSGAFRKGYFEPYQEIAAKAKLGVWRSAPKAELKNAMSYTPSQGVASKASQRAVAAGVDPYGFNGVVQTPSLNPGPAPTPTRKLMDAKTADYVVTDPNATLKAEQKTLLENIKWANANGMTDVVKGYEDRLRTINEYLYNGVPMEQQVAPARTNDNWFDQMWDSADGERLGVNGPLDMIAHQVQRAGNAVGSVLDPVINADKTGTLDAVTKFGIGAGTSAGVYPGAMSNPDRPMSDPGKVTMDTAGYNPFNPVGDAQQKQQVNSPAPNPVMNGSPVTNGSQGTLTGGGVEQVNVGNPGTGTTPNQQTTPTTGREVYPTPDGLPPTGQTVATTPGTGGNSSPPPSTSPSSPLVNGGTATDDKGWKFDPMTGLVIGGGVTGAVGSVVAGNAMAQAQVDAANIQANAAEKARALQEKMYDQSRTDLTPWRSAGEEALGYDRDAQGQLVERASGGLRTFEQDNPQFKVDPFKFDMDARSPAYNKAYNFRLSEGLKALQSSAAAKGMLRSGNTMQAITDYGQGLASQEVDNEFNRYQTNTTNEFNRFNAQRGSKLNALQSLAGVGQSAVSQLSNAGQNYASNAGNSMMTGANAQAAGMTGAANDRASGWVGGIQTGMNALGTAINYNNQRDMTNAFTKYYGS